MIGVHYKDETYRPIKYFTNSGFITEWEITLYLLCGPNLQDFIRLLVNYGNIARMQILLLSYFNSFKWLSGSPFSLSGDYSYFLKGIYGAVNPFNGAHD